MLFCPQLVVHSVSTLTCVLRRSVRTERLVQTSRARKVYISAPVTLDSPATIVNTTSMSAPAILVRMEQRVMTWSIATTAPVVLVTMVSDMISRYLCM